MTTMNMTQRKYALERVKVIEQSLLNRLEIPKRKTAERPKTGKCHHWSRLDRPAQIALIKKWVKSRKLRFKDQKELLALIFDHTGNQYSGIFAIDKIVDDRFGDLVTDFNRASNEEAEAADNAVKAEQKKFDAIHETAKTYFTAKATKIKDEATRVSDQIMLAGSEGALQALEAFTKFKP